MSLIQYPFIDGIRYFCSGIVSHGLLALATIVALPLPLLRTVTFFLRAVPLLLLRSRLVIVFRFTCTFAIVDHPIHSGFKIVSVTTFILDSILFG